MILVLSAIVHITDYIITAMLPFAHILPKARICNKVKSIITTTEIIIIILPANLLFNCGSTDTAKNSIASLPHPLLYLLLASLTVD